MANSGEIRRLFIAVVTDFFGKSMLDYRLRHMMVRVERN